MTRAAKAAVAAVVLALAVAGCAPLAAPSPSPSPRSSAAPVDAAAAQQHMFATLPELLDGFDIAEGDGRELITLTLETSIEDHQAHTVAGAYRMYTSHGWSQNDSDEAYWFAMSMVLMDSVRAADAFMHEIAMWEQAYTNDYEHSTVEFLAPRRPHSEYLPFGSVERDNRITWTNGWTGTGRTTWLSAGPFIAVLTYEAVDGSETVASAVVEERYAAWAAEFVELPDRVAPAE